MKSFLLLFLLGALTFLVDAQGKDLGERSPLGLSKIMIAALFDTGGGMMTPKVLPSKLFMTVQKLFREES